MKILSSPAYETACRFVETLAPPVDKALFEHHVRGGLEEDIIKALATYQNPDGGFGNGLEMDFTYPGSSPMSTSVALQTLAKHDDTTEALRMAAEAVHYLEQTYDPRRPGWLALPLETKEHPHAPWWDVDSETGMCAIDNHWGNPSAEISGYAYRYRDLLETLDADNLVETAISHLESITEYVSFHEMYCYVRMARQMPPSVASHMHSLISRAVSELVSTNPAEWDEYVAKPLDFAPRPDSERYGIGDAAIEANLDYLVEQLEHKGCISPAWSWTDYKDVWMAQKVKWVGALTSRALVTLEAFGRLVPL